MTIREAAEDDCEAIAKVQLEASKTAYADIFPPFENLEAEMQKRTQTWRTLANDSKTDLLVSDREDRINAFVHFGRCRDNDLRCDEDAEIWSIYVLPATWRKGTGGALLKEAIGRLQNRGCKSLSLWVLEKNEIGIGFYRSYGFVTDGAVKKHQSGVTEIRMTKQIQE